MDYLLLLDQLRKGPVRTTRSEPVARIVRDLRRRGFLIEGRRGGDYGLGTYFLVSEPLNASITLRPRPPRRTGPPTKAMAKHLAPVPRLDPLQAAAIPLWEEYR